MAFTVYEFENTKLCNSALSKAIADLIHAKNLTHLAVSGGKSPLAFFHCLREEELEWEKMSISLIDERIVPLDDEESNTAFIKRELLQKKASKAKFIAMLENIDLNDKELLALANKNYEQVHIGVLGMGTDGHTASLFANSQGFDFALKTEQNIVLITPKNASFRRLSMSLNALEKCHKLFLLIQGDEKKQVFKKASLKADENLPISLILHSKKVQCDVYYSK